MRVVTKPVSEIDTADYNPRVELTEDDPEFHHLAESIDEFGIVDPLIFNEKTGRLVAGHQRLNVAIHLGYDEVPVALVNVDPDREQLLNIALNRIQGRWDDAKLADILSTFEDTHGIDELTVAGFTPEDYDDVLRRVDQAHATDFLDDLTQSDEELKDQDVEDVGDVPDAFDETWYAMSFSVTKDERQDILAGLRLARDVFDLDTSPKALHAMCLDFIDGREADGYELTDHQREALDEFRAGQRGPAAQEDQTDE